MIMKTLITDLQQPVGKKLIDVEYMKKAIIIYEDYTYEDFLNHINNIRNCDTIITNLEENHG